MKLTSDKPDVPVPFYKQRNRKKTPHVEAMRCMERGWTWNGRKYECRESWTAAMKDSFEKTQAKRLIT